MWLKNSNSSNYVLKVLSASIPTPEELSNSRLSVLVADDQLVMRDLLTALLRNLKIIKIDSAADGTLAVDYFRKTQHDIVFLDIDMPETDGLAALRKMIEIKPDAFVVMVSGNSSINNVKAALKLGSKGFIVKPYSTAKINDMLNKHRGMI